MRISKLHIINYRSILDESLDCDKLTVLIGRNGAGKSAFLQALRLFMEPASAPAEEDFYNRDSKRPILIEATFSDLSEEEQAEFQSYLDEGLLVVQRRFPGGEYYGRTSGCEELEQIRNRLRQKGVKVGEVALELKKLVDSGEFKGLNAVNKSIDEELNRWERENPSRCHKFFRAGLFQGPTNIAGGKMRNRTHFVYVAPVREAEADASGGGKQSPLAALVGPLVNAITDNNAAVKTARDSLEGGYSTYKGAVEGAPEKGILETNLTKLLQRYDDDAAALIQLNLEDKLPLPPVKPRVWLVEDGFQGEVARKGHGLQRLFIFTILELYEKFRGGVTDTTPGNMVLAIEEPELYQHPARSRALARVLSELCNPKEVGGFQFQVLFSTHSPYFVSIDNFQSIRRVEKVATAYGPMETKVRRTSLKEVGDAVLQSLGRDNEATEASSWARLKSVMGIRGSEGFFADGIILVEGAEDEAIIGAYAEHKNISLDAAGISIIPADGKTKLPSLFALYDLIGIAVYLIFDADGDQPSDEKAKTDFNKALLTLIGEQPEARPTTKIAKNGATWRTNFLDEVQSAFGKDKWETAFEEACNEFAITSDQAKKKYAVIWKTVELVLAQKIPCEPLEKLWEAIAERFALETKGIEEVTT